jgi:predicted P-loop ATPase
MITREMKAALRARGFTDDEIAQITPERAHEILNGNPLTQAQKDALRARGLIDDEIDLLTSEQADQIIRNFTPEAAQKYLNNISGKPTPEPPPKSGEPTATNKLNGGGTLRDPDRAPEQSESVTFLEKLRPGGPWAPTTIVPDGKATTILVRLTERIELGPLVDGKLSDEDKTKIADIEARILALTLRLGGDRGTQNIDRIMRLPGTTNLPNAKKRRAGRTECQAKLLWFDDTSYPLDAFPKDAPNKKEPNKKKAAGREKDWLEQIIDEGAPQGERSEAVWRVVNEMLRRGHRTETIVQVLLDCNNGISEHIYDQAKPNEYAARQVKQAIEKIEFICNEKGKILPIPANIRIALLKLGVSVRYDQFADRTLLDGLPGYGPTLDDAAVNHLWLQFAERLGFSSKLELMHIVISDTARLNGFHPVRDYLDALQWDGVPRLNRWLTTYGGAEDNGYTQAVGTLLLIAAVRRVRQPGCKFDEMLILEQPQQGTDKSSAWAVMAVHEDWFTDDLPLNVEGKRVIEQTRGKWIIEAAELSGIRKADAEHLKATLSRRVDRGRLAYGRLPTEVPRQFIVVGSINKTEYLRDTTGNRRFWPILIKQFDLDALRRDRDQLWAEAAVCEAKGESIRLARELWPEAAKEQQQRLADDPFVAVLATHIGHLEGKIKAADVWEILNLHGAQLTQDIYARAAEAMKRIGWERPNKAGILRFDGRPMAAYVRGDSQKTIEVVRDRDGLRVMERDDNSPEIEAFLRETLKDGKPVPQQEIEEAAKAKGFTEKQLRTARRNLSIEIIKEPGKEHDCLLWCLPDFNKGSHYYE